MHFKRGLALVGMAAILLTSGCGGCASGLQQTFTHTEAPDGMARISVAYSPEEGFLLTSGTSGVKLWDIASGNVVGTAPVKGANPFAVFASNGTRVVTTDEHLLSVWDVAQLRRAGTGGVADDVPRSVSTEATLSRLSVSNDGTRALAVSDVGAILFDLGIGSGQAADAGPVRVLAAYRHPQKQMAEYLLHPDGRTYYVGHKNGTVEERAVDEFGESTAAKAVMEHPATVAGLALDRDGNRLAVALGSKSVQVWQVRPGPPKPIGMAVAHDEEITCLAMSPDGKLLATATTAPSKTGVPDASEVRLWATETGSRVGSTYSVRWCRGIAFAPDGGSFATAEATGKVKLWKVPDSE